MMKPKGKSFRIIVLGEAGVGKSSLIRRYTQGNFLQRTTTTVGVDRIPFDINVDDEVLNFQVLDTAGCFGFRGLIKSYMTNIDAVIFVYDLTNKESFASLPLWNTILKNSGKRDITKILVGNKRDLDDRRQVEFKNAKNYAEFEGMVNMEISVKKEESVDLVFQCVARELKLKRELASSLEKKKENEEKKSYFSKRQSIDFIDVDEKESSPKRFVRQLSLMVMGRKKKARRESPTTPAVTRRKYEYTNAQSIKIDHYRWT